VDGINRHLLTKLESLVGTIGYALRFGMALPCTNPSLFSTTMWELEGVFKVRPGNTLT
jgi:hypothetical protein